MSDLIQSEGIYLDSRGLETALNEFKRFKEKERYSEEHKWEIFQNLNSELQEVNLSESNITEIIEMLRNENPKEGSFCHWGELKALEQYAKKDPKGAAEKLKTLKESESDLALNIQEFRNAVNENSEEDYRINAPGTAYVLASFNIQEFVPYKAGAYTKFVSWFSNQYNVSGSVSEKLVDYYNLCESVQNFADFEDLLSAQDMIYSTTNYQELEYRIPLLYLWKVSQEWTDFSEDTSMFLDKISRLPVDHLRQKQEGYSDDVGNVNEIRFRVLQRINNKGDISVNRLEEIKEEVNSKSDTNVTNSWSNFSILGQIYLDFFQNLKKNGDYGIWNYIADKLKEELEYPVSESHIVDFSGAQHFMTKEPWIALYPQHYSSHRDAPQFFFQTNSEHIKYGLSKGDRFSNSIEPDYDYQRQESDVGLSSVIEKFKDVKGLIEDLQNSNRKQIWIEKSYHNREKRQQGDRRFGKALWAPQEKKNNHNSVYYDNLKEISPGDIVLHLDQDSREIVGVSKAQSEYEETQVLENTEWDDIGVREMGYERGERPCYLVELKDYREFNHSLPVDKIFTKKNESILDEIRENYSGLVFNKNYNLNQGAYLTEAPNKLVQLIQGAYTEETGKQMPFIEVEGMQASTDSDLSIIDDLYIDIDSDDSGILEGLHFPEGVDNDIVERVEAALNSGKHIIFTGPPGTGKTEIAERTAKYISSNQGDSNVTGYQLTTATSDWSTFDTVGGYMPDKESKLDFKPGHILRRFKQNGKQENELLVIDEINRSDIDKAFGQLFTVLSGQRVQLPFKDGEDENSEKEVELIPAKELEKNRKPDTNEYLIPNSWRIMATMNTYDKTSLYEMSYAFMRRFSFVHIGAPEIPQDEDKSLEMIEKYIDAWEDSGEEFDLDEEDKRAVIDIWKVTNNDSDDKEFKPRKIGPALIHDMLSYLTHRECENSKKKVTEAVISYIIPQLEGIPKRDQLVNAIDDTGRVESEMLDSSADDILR